MWPEGLAHYVEEHGVRLPDEFVRHAYEVLDRLEEATVDEDRWHSQTGFE